ncbi:MAG: hypothetical protein JNK68_09595 [Betaproteobacteria bacterium]|nr:hypothetical protein [Betaproteobacteria bacterium]
MADPLRMAPADAARRRREARRTLPDRTRCRGTGFHHERSDLRARFGSVGCLDTLGLCHRSIPPHRPQTSAADGGSGARRVRAGLRAESGTDLLEKLVGLRMEALHELVDEINEQVDEIEDQVLRGRVTEQRELLGRLRRDCARLRRSFTPERTALQKVLIHSQPALGERLVGWLRSISDDLAFLTEEVLALQERAKLLQEELAARVAEDTGQKLNALTALTAAFLPMTLISGIWGMNVAGLPGTEDTGAFAWVALLILAAGCITLGTLYLKKLF